MRVFPDGAVNRGVAYESDLLVVKMGIPRQDSFPRTTELMQGVDYLVRQAYGFGKTNCDQFQLWK